MRVLAQRETLSIRERDSDRRLFLDVQIDGRWHFRFLDRRTSDVVRGMLK